MPATEILIPVLLAAIFMPILMRSVAAAKEIGVYE
jgi:hypothetical protein